MSSSVGREYVRMQRTTLHPLLSISVPFLFLLCLDVLLRAVLPALRFPPPLFLLVPLLIGVEVTVTGNIFRDERAGIAARIRELIAVMALVYSALIVVKSVQARAFVPAHLDFIYPLALAFLQWISSSTVHQHLRDREFFLEVLVGKEGEVLLHDLRDASLQASASLRSLRALKILLSLYQFLIFALLCVALVRQATVGTWSVILCGLHAVYGFLVVAVINTMSEDQLLLGEGIVVPPRMEASRLVVALVVVAAGLPIVFLLSRNASPLPLSLLAALLEKFINLFPTRSAPDLAQRMQEFIRSRLRYEQMLLSSVPNVPINPLVFLFMELIRRLMVTIGATVLYFFLVSPLMSEEFLQGLRRRSPIAFLARKLRALYRFIVSAAYVFLEWLRTRDGGRRTREREAKEDGRTRERKRSHPRSIKKRLQVGRVLKAFLLLLKWGNDHGIGYRGFETPREYSERLLPAVPMREGELALIVEVLEEALFSSHLVGRERIAAYFSAIRLIRNKAA